MIEPHSAFINASYSTVSATSIIVMEMLSPEFYLVIVNNKNTMFGVRREVLNQKLV